MCNEPKITVQQALEEGLSIGARILYDYARTHGYEGIVSEIDQDGIIVEFDMPSHVLSLRLHPSISIQVVED